VRAKCLAAFESAVDYVTELAADPTASPKDRLAAITLLGKYAGLQNLTYDPEEGVRREQDIRRSSELLSSL